jgi:hypothetical protein
MWGRSAGFKVPNSMLVSVPHKTPKFAENIFSSEFTIAMLTSLGHGIEKRKRLTLRNGKFRRTEKYPHNLVLV